MSKFISINQVLIKHRLLIIQSMQCGTLMAVGDLVAQIGFENKRTFQELTLIRTVHFGLLGTCLVGPAVATWYAILSRRNISTLKKVILDQMIFAPSFLPIVMISINVLRGKSWREIKEEFNAKYFEILLANYKVWPLVQFFNFGFMPLKYQMVFNQSVAVLWNAYLSWKIVKKP